MILIMYVYNISIAIGTDRGLVVPVLKGVDELSFAEIERNIFQLSEKAKEGNSFGQLNLGVIYLEGDYGVRNDKVKAMLWLSRAADNGSKGAECILDSM